MEERKGVVIKTLPLACIRTLLKNDTGSTFGLFC